MVTNLVHQFPAFLHRLFVHGPGLVMGVEVVMVWLEGILHHSNDPPAFLQVPCHVLALFRSGRQAGEARQGSGKPNRHQKLARPVDGDPVPPCEDSARVANPSQGPMGG